MVRWVGKARDDTKRGKRDDDTLLGKKGNDHLYGGGGDDHIEGGPGDDWLKGNSGKDTIAGDGGNDRIWGQGGDDVLGGGAGDDVIRGGGGADQLFGGAGTNELHGGKGADQFFLSRDPEESGSSMVRDFDFDAGDRIRLDVDLNGDEHLDPDEYRNWQADMDALKGGIFVDGDDTVFALPALSGSALSPAAAGDGGASMRLAGLTLGGNGARQAIYDFGVNGGQESQVATNPSRSSNETESTVAPALNTNGRFFAVISQVNLDDAAEPPSDPEDSEVLRDIFVYDALTFGGLGDNAADDVMRVNTSASGELGRADGGSDQVGDSVSISGDGRFVAFSSNATNLATTDQTTDFDVFVKDLLTGAIRHASDGIASGGATAPSLSPDGRTVAFISEGAAFASGPDGDLVPIDAGTAVIGVALADNGKRAIIETEPLDSETSDSGIFVAELRNSGPAVRFLSNGTNADLSADGRFVVYDDSDSGQVVRREIDGGETVVVSRSAEGERGADISSNASISEDGRFVAFASDADNLVPNDTNERSDIFVKDLDNGEIVRVSIDDRGQQAFGGDSLEPTISAKGQFVAYTTDAPNLQDLFVSRPPDATGDPEPLNNGRTVVWSPVDFDRVALPDLRGDERTDAELRVGGSIASDIAAIADTDSIRVVAADDQLYRFTVTADPLAASNIDLPFVDLRREGDFGSIADTAEGSFRYWSTQSEDLFVVAEGNPFIDNDELGMFLGAYEIALTAIDVPDSTGSPATLAIDDPVRQVIDQPDDRDWYRIELEADQSYRFRMRGASSDHGSLSDPELELYDASGVPQAIGQDDVLPGNDLDALLEFTAPAVGSYFVSADAGETATGSYTLTAAQIGLGPTAALVEAQPADLPAVG